MRGHIRKRGDSWQLIFDLPPDADGGRRQARHTVHGSKKAADAKLRELLRAVETGGYVAPVADTVGTLLEKWLTSYVASNTSPRTQRDYSYIARHYLSPALGGIPLTRLRPEHVQKLYADMLNRGLSSRTVTHTHRILFEALKHAVKWRLLARNVCEAVDPPRTERKPMRSLDTDGASHFLKAAATSRYHDVFFVALHTGLRRSELMALKWSAVDVELSELSVVAGLHRLAGQGLVLLPTKTARSRRRVSLTAEARDLLRTLRVRQAEQRLALGPAWHDEGFVFTTGDGHPLDPEKVTHAFTAIVRSAGLTGVRLHDLRHTHASLMLKAGVHPKVVSERLGHASVSITLDVYSHVLPGLQEDAVDRFSKLLARPVSG